MQELVTIAGVLEGINALAAEDAKVQAMRGGLRLNTGKCSDTIHEPACHLSVIYS